MDSRLKPIGSVVVPSVVPSSRSGSPFLPSQSRSGSPTLSQMQGQTQPEKKIANIPLAFPIWEIKGKVYRDFLLETQEFKDLKGVTYVALETTKK